jgi:hypothetical protein
MDKPSNSDNEGEESADGSDYKSGHGIENGFQKLLHRSIPTPLAMIR